MPDISGIKESNHHGRGLCSIVDTDPPSDPKNRLEGKLEAIVFFFSVTSYCLLLIPKHVVSVPSGPSGVIDLDEQNGGMPKWSYQATLPAAAMTDLGEPNNVTLCRSVCGR